MTRLSLDYTGTFGEACLDDRCSSYDQKKRTGRVEIDASGGGGEGEVGRRDERESEEK